MFYCLSFYDGIADRHIPCLDCVFDSRYAARKKRIELIKGAKGSEALCVDWGHWWCVTRETGAGRLFYRDPQDECGILIEEFTPHEE